MVRSAPHLPIQARRVNIYQQLKKIGWIFLVVAIAWLAGFTGALMVVGWLAPVNSGEVLVRLNSSGNKNQLAAPDPLLLRQINQRVATIYDLRKKVDNKFYGDNSFISQAAILSSDGWLVAFVNKNNLGQEKNWEVVDYQGKVYKVEKRVYDNLSRLTYLKVNGDGFRIMSLVDSQNITWSSVLWSLNNNFWKATSLGDFSILNNVNKNELSIWRLAYERVLEPVVESGSLLFDNQGQLAGLVDDGGKIVPSFFASLQINSILSSGSLQYQGLDLTGYFIKKVFVNDNWQEINGFYVSQSKTKPSASAVGRGDVILQIENEPPEEFNLVEQIYSAPDKTTLTVLRGGKEVKVQVEKKVVYPAQ